jgi:hypothetical protein
VLKAIRGLSAHPSLVQQLGFDEPPQFPWPRRLIQVRHRLEQLIGQLSPNGGPSWRDPFGGDQSVQACHQGVVPRWGNGEGRQGAGELVVVLRLSEHA